MDKFTEAYYETILAAYPAVRFVVGVDEAGCGALAGPLVVAAAAFPVDMPRVTLTWKTVRGERQIAVGDSKAIKEAARRAALSKAVTSQATALSVIERTAAEIDARLFGTVFPEAVRLAASRCIEQLVLRDPALRPEDILVLVDGDLERPEMPCPVRCIAGGDAIDWRIGAASVLAKARHDVRVDELHAEYPTWGFDAHRGYPTKGHKELIARRGPTDQHRKSYRPVRAMAPASRGIEE